jgi:hypothetical protein
METEIEEYVCDPIVFSDDLLILKLTKEQLVEEFLDEVEDIEPKVSCKKNTTEELVRILKLNRARKDDN